MMGGVIGETLPLSVGIALNPIAIVVGILILATAGARKNGLAFTIGWVTGLLALLLLAALLIQHRTAADPAGTRTIVSVGKVVLGVMLIVVSIRELRDRPPPGEEAEPPRWMRMLDNVGILRSFALGLFLSLVSLKNIALVAAAAGVIGQAELGVRGIVAADVIFVLFCTFGILVPLLVHLLGGERADDILAAWRAWLGRHFGAITAVVMVVLGANLIGSGIGNLV